MLQQSWNVLKSIDMNDKRANKSSWIDAPRGLWFYQSWRKKPRTLKPRRCQAMLRSLCGWNQTLHLPTVEREVFLWKWKSCQLSAAEMLYLQAASPAEEGIRSALLVPPSLHLTAILSKSFCSVFSCRRPQSRCPASPAVDFLFFTRSFISKQQKRPSKHVRRVCAGGNGNVYIFWLYAWVHYHESYI